MPLSHLWWMSLVLLGSFPCVAATSKALTRLKSILEGIISEPRKLAIVVVCASVVVIAVLIWLIHIIAGCVRKRRLRKRDGRQGVPPQPPSNDASLSELEAATKVPSPTPSSNPTSCASLKSPLDDVTTFNVGLPTRLTSHKLSKGTSRASQTPDRKPYRRRSQDNSRQDVPHLPFLNISLDRGRLPDSERRGSLTADEQIPSSGVSWCQCIRDREKEYRCFQTLLLLRARVAFAARTRVFIGCRKDIRRAVVDIIQIRLAGGNSGARLSVTWRLWC
ncbi:hypothetical protein EDD15DRAFT_128777 [Pisolithus albus]|nr:hypothetical protein EDD15DRAFT_128777 [Pisolithus albus]